MKKVFVILCILGTAYPYYYIFKFIETNNWEWSTSIFFEQIHQNYAMTILIADLTIAATSFLIFLIYKSLLINNTTINPFLFVFIGEILPFKSTGSFFTTSNSTYIFLLIAVIISISVKKRFELNL